MQKQLEYDVIEFIITNKQEIITEIAPNVKLFLENEKEFEGDYNQFYQKAFKEFLLREIRNLLMPIFNLNFEQISVIINYETP
jgi:hypothetical protein